MTASCSKSDARVLLRPFFSFFGSKWTLAPHYPAPEHDVIIEPFAGSAGYSTRYHDREVILVERDPVIAKLWRWLIRASSDEILSLPANPNDPTDHLHSNARSLIGFWCARARTQPARTTKSSWLNDGRWPTSFWGEHIKSRVADQVNHIRHWQVIEGDYRSAPEYTATWFIDPPYKGSRHYRASVRDYDDLATWTLSRRGLVVACEGGDADWLPFRHFREAKSVSRVTTTELVFVQRKYS